jgi:AcrR family transcriptional regulator
VLERSGVSRGSLYHHFASKEALFEAVLEQVEARVARETVDAARDIHDPVEALRAAGDAWLRLTADPVVRQVVLIDAPAVIGWRRWREIDERHAFGVLKRAVEASGRASADLLAHVVLAAMIEIAMLVARDERRLAEGREALDGVLVALLAAGGGD